MKLNHTCLVKRCEYEYVHACVQMLLSKWNVFVVVLFLFCEYMCVHACMQRLWCEWNCSITVLLLAPSVKCKINVILFHCVRCVYVRSYTFYLFLIYCNKFDHGSCWPTSNYVCIVCSWEINVLFCSVNNKKTPPLCTICCSTAQ